MRRLNLLVAMTIVATVLCVAPSEAAPIASPAPVPCGASQVRTIMRNGNMETVALRTYYVEMKADKKVYKVGDTAIVHATVTRPAHEDPLGLKQEFDPPQSFPAEGANMGVGLRIGDVFLFGFGITDANGKADVKIKLKPYTPAGTALVDGFAWKREVETPCLNVEENGYTFAPGLFKVIKL